LWQNLVCGTAAIAAAQYLLDKNFWQMPKVVGKVMSGA